MNDGLFMPDGTRRPAPRHLSAENARDDVAVNVSMRPGVFQPDGDDLDAYPTLTLTWEAPKGWAVPKPVTLVLADQDWLPIMAMLERAANHARDLARKANRDRRPGGGAPPG